MKLAGLLRVSRSRASELRDMIGFNQNYLYTPGCVAGDCQDFRVRPSGTTSQLIVRTANLLDHDQGDLTPKGHHAMTERDTVFAPGDRTLYDRARYSAAVRSGNLLFVSGQVGALENGSPEPDFTKQVQVAYDRLGAVLSAAGCTVADVVDVTIFSTDPKNHAPVSRAAGQKAFGGPLYTNLTIVGVSYLSGSDFEIKVVARILPATLHRSPDAIRPPCGT